MMHTGTSKSASGRKKYFAILAVLIMVFSAFAVISDRSPVASAEPDAQTSLQTDVIYHAADAAVPVDTNYNADTPYTTIRSFTYYGTVISTEYNPQVWEFTDDRWFALVKDSNSKEKYQDGVTYVFTGWKIATAGSVVGTTFTPTDFTAVQDPGDIIRYNSADGHWYVNYDSANPVRVDPDAAGGKIHVYATWGLLAHSVKDPSSTNTRTWTDGSKYQNIILISGEKKVGDTIDKVTAKNIGYTVRAESLDNVAASKLIDHGGAYTLKNPVIIDNISMRYTSGKAGGADFNTGSYVFIIGTGINSIKTNGTSTSGGVYGHYATLQGGNSGNNLMIVHSGIYSSIFGGGKANCKSVTIMNGGVVLDTLSGGAPSGGGVTGDLYLYMTGVTTFADSYTDYLLNHENEDTKAANTTTSKDEINGVLESSMIVGGSHNNKSNSTHLFLTGTSDVWTIQAAGRALNSYIEGDAEMEISGKAIVRNVACGGLTDALKDPISTSHVGGDIKITVRDAPIIACLVGGGYDTFNYSNGACFLGDGSINLTVKGGTIGYIYGGGLRGPIGTASKPTTINITIDGGNILKDVYGGGSGTLVKIKHRYTYGEVVTNDAYHDTTGVAYVYGNININVTGGTVNGSVYGGGKSVAVISSYGVGGTYKDHYFDKVQQNVAMVTGNTTVNVSGGDVLGSVYGAGRGLDTTTLVDQDAINSEYSSLFVIRNKTSPTTPAWADPNSLVRSDISINEDLEFSFIPWAYQDLKSSTKVGVVFNDLGTAYEEFAKVTGNTAVNISSDCVIQGSVYGGGQIGKLYGTTSVHITGGTVMGMVYGGGLGTLGRMSVQNTRRITVGGNANIAGSVYGGSALGTDGKSDTVDADVYIYIKAGSIAGSIFGGGFQGTTYGSVHMFVGVDSLELSDSSNVLADDGEDITLSIGESIYLGGDVGVLENSKDAYKQDMVMGNGELFMEQNSETNNISFSGTIMGSGNSCLTKGTTTIHLKNLTTFSTSAAEAIHRATEVTLEGCVLELNGRATIENTLDVIDTDYTLYRIEKLNLKGGTTLVLNGAINYVYELDSLNNNGDSTTSTSPLNKIVVGGGNTFTVKGFEWKENPAEDEKKYTDYYGLVKGYTILAARSNEQQYGVLALGSPASPGGFVVLKAGTFEAADHSDLTEDCRCWYISGAINNEVTVTAVKSEIEKVSVDMPSLQSGSSYRYTGGIFIPDSPGDANLISTDGTVGDNEFEVRFGCSDGSDNCLVFADDPDHEDKGALMRNDLGQGDPILGLKTGGASVRNPYMVIKVASSITEFKYIGYVVISVNEVMEVELESGTAYVVVNSIQTKVHIYTETASFGENTDLDITVVDGSGSATFLIPSGMAGSSFIVDSIAPQAGATGVSAFGITAIKNMNNTPGWTDSLGKFVVRTDGVLTSAKIGTLQGGYNASLKVEVNGFSTSGVQKYDMAVRIVKDDVNIESFTITLNVSKTPNVSVTFHVNSETQLKYTYTYGTSITLPDCPPTDDNFVGWYTDSTFNNPFTFTFPLTRDMDLYARYMYEVTLDYMDGTSSVVYVEMPSGFIGNIETPKRPGYSFGGWYTDTDYTQLWRTTTDPVTQSMTLYAYWVGWNVKVNFQVDFGSGYLDVDLDPSSAQHHTGDVLDCQIMEFGKKFDTSDNFTVESEPVHMTLLDWAQYNLSKMDGFKGYKFIYWTYKIVDASGKVVPVYTDTNLDETSRLLTDEDGYVIEDGCYVVVLAAKVSKVAIRVDMDSKVMEGGQSVDNLALVDPPSSFLIFPYEETTTSYTMKIELNGATRPGYSLEGWKLVQRTDGCGTIVGATYIYQAGTNIVLYVHENEGTDAEEFPWIAEFKVSDVTVQMMKITPKGVARMDGTDSSDNLVIEFVSEWERIPYSVSIADPPHGTIVAMYDDEGTPVQFDDSSFFYGDIITLIFTPDAGYEFHHWYSSGEGIFSAESSVTTTYVVQGDTNISAYLIGPQIVRVYVEYDGLYKEPEVDDTLNCDGVDYTVEAVNLALTATNGVKFIVTGGTGATVIFVPAGVTVEVGDTLTVGTTDYTVAAFETPLEDLYSCARFIVTDDANHYATIVEYYLSDEAIPNFYWKNGTDKVYFTKSVYTLEMTNGHTLIQYTGTAVLGTHNSFLEGRAFGGEYLLGLPITSTTLQNVYYLMTPKTLYSMAPIPDGAETGTDTTQNVDFAVTIPSENGATISKVKNTTASVISIGDEVKDGSNTYGVVGIAPGAIESCTALKWLTIGGNTIYRFGFVSVYTNGVKDHITDSHSGEIAGIGSGIAGMKEYVLDYYLDDAPDGVDASKAVTMTLEAGYYRYYDEDGEFINNSTETELIVTVTSYITDNVVLGSITRTKYTVEIYYGTENPDGDPVTVAEDIYFGDNYLDILSSYKSVPPDGDYKVYAWYIMPYTSTSKPISSDLTLSGDPADTIMVFGKYVASKNKVTVWMRTQVSSGTYSDISFTETVLDGTTAHYTVDPKSGYVAKYDVDSKTAVTAEYLAVHVYGSSTTVTGNPITVTGISGTTQVIVITYYCATVNVTIYDAVHPDGDTIEYMLGEIVPLVHTADDIQWHYGGWTRDDGEEVRPITVPMEGYSVSIEDVEAGDITIRETRTLREYSVSVVTSLAEIHKGEVNKGSAVILSIPYGTGISTDVETDRTLLIIDGYDYKLCEYSRYADYYDMSQGCWLGVPEGGEIVGDVVITYKWVPKTYQLRVVFDNTVTVSGTDGSTPMLFNDVSFTVNGTADSHEVTGEQPLEGIEFIITDPTLHLATVISTNGKTVVIGDTFEYGSHPYTVTAITEYKETEDGVKFIVNDWYAKTATALDVTTPPSTVVQKGPKGTVTLSPGDLRYGTNIWLTLVFTGSYTIDETNTKYINPDPHGDDYNLQPKKQSSMQKWVISFFVSGDMEIVIKSKWEGQHINFFIKGTEEGAFPMIDPSMTKLVAEGEYYYLPIADYEWIERLDIEDYYFDGWYTGTDYLKHPEVVISNGRYCFKLGDNVMSVYARYVPIIPESGDYSMTYDGTEQYVDLIPKIDLPLNVSQMSFTYEDEPGHEITVNTLSITNVDESISNVTYAFTPAKLYAYVVDGVTYYVMSGVDHQYTGTFDLVMSPRQVIVIANGDTRFYNGEALTCNSYSVFGLAGGSLTTVDSETSYTGTITNPGSVACSVSITPISSNYEVIAWYQGTLTVIGATDSRFTSKVAPAEASATGSDPITITYEDDKVVVMQGETKLKEFAGHEGRIVLNDATITAESGPAIAIGDGCYVTIVIKGTCTLTGGAGYDGIMVGTGAALTLTGDGTLIVSGSNGSDASGSGSGIGYAAGTPGEITVSEMAGLSAYGYGTGGYGIGGTGATVIICDSTITVAQGGYASSTTEGAPGIGGSDIRIIRSEVTAVGGCYAAAIGSGYDRDGTLGLCIIRITDRSQITATGGMYAASIGSGYRHALLTGFHDGTCTITLPERDDMAKTDSPTYWEAQYVGFGVLDPDSEAADIDKVYFYRALTTVPLPTPPGGGSP